MSNSPFTAQITSPVPPLVRSLSKESSDHHHVSTTSQTLPKPIKSTPLAFSTKAKNFPPLTSPSTTLGEQLPQLSERDSIFATHYLSTESTATSFLAKPIQGSNCHFVQDGKTNLDFTAPLPSSASEPPLLPHKTRSSPSIASLVSNPPHSHSDFSYTYSPPRLIDLQEPAKHIDEHLQKHPELRIPQHSPSSSKILIALTRYQRTQSQGSLVHARMSEPWYPLVGNTNASSEASEDTSNTRQDRTSMGRRKRSSSRDNVEKRIEATLANEEAVPNPRSRKASHYFGLFKENTTSQDQKKGRDKSKSTQSRSDDEASSNRDYTQEGKDVKSIEEYEDSSLAPSEAPVDDTGIEKSRSETEQKEQRQSQRNISSGTKLGLPRSPISDAENIEWRSSSASKHALPLSLLEEIRNYPKPRSTPSSRNEALSERAPKHVTELVDTSAVLDRETGEPSTLISQDQNPDGAKVIDIEAEEYESEKEQISSAMYYPHQGLSPDSSDSCLDQIDEFESTSDTINRSQVPSAHLGTVLEEPPELADEVTIALNSEDESRCLHGDLPPVGSSTLPEELGKAFDAPISSASDTEYESWDDSTRSVRGDESGATDDGELTPTATPTKQGIDFYSKKKAIGPVGAVELKPYKHQVGGHSTVFRFSKRAVCKQLSNRENEFYEVIERRHPELLRFLPRYIGVLNVTYRKAPKRQRVSKETGHLQSDPNIEATSILSDGQSPASSRTIPSPTEKPGSSSSRTVSHSQQNESVPHVVFANNRHIIPDDLFPSRTRTNSSHASSIIGALHEDSVGHDEQPTSQQHRTRELSFLHEPPTRPSLHKQQPSWGATTVNTKFQKDVLREVFTPPPIHRSRPRRGRNQKRLSRAKGLQDTAISLHSHSSVPDLHLGEGFEMTNEGDTKTISKSIKDVDQSAAHSEDCKLHDILEPDKSVVTSDLEPLDRVHTTGSDVNQAGVTNDKRVRRRHSGSGLRRRQTNVDSPKRGDLEYFEDDGYGGDGEDGLLSTNFDGLTPTLSFATNKEKESLAKKNMEDAVEPATPGRKPPCYPIRDGKDITSSQQLHNPCNPIQAQIQPDERVRHFILLEDLTSGMVKPCVLDLKMGTRQYGIEATEKKRKSQQQKCKSTTSRQLGVRLCGMQVWNTRTETYLFEDKYAGRDLKAGREVQDALTRFLYDGSSYTSVLRHVPILLEKIDRMEKLIRNLTGYRFYASSLLFLYDGGIPIEKQELSTESKAPIAEMDHQPQKATLPKSNIDIKIVDFANCVTGEDELPDSVLCPPQDPKGVDRGYLRGLRTLRTYLRRIWKEINSDEYYVERGEGEGMGLRQKGAGRSVEPAGWGADDQDENPGYVSV